MRWLIVSIFLFYASFSFFYFFVFSYLVFRHFLQIRRQMPYLYQLYTLSIVKSQFVLSLLLLFWHSVKIEVILTRMRLKCTHTRNHPTLSVRLIRQQQPVYSQAKCIRVKYSSHSSDITLRSPNKILNPNFYLFIVVVATIGGKTK